MARGCWLTFIIILILSNLIFAQVPLNPIGNNSPSLKWNQIKSDRYQVIFPEGKEPAARRVASIIDYLWELEDPSVGPKRNKVSIMLQSDAAISNGFVTVGPFRSEFFPANRQFGNATDYLDLLTIHEYRHVQQFANATHGITKTVKNVLGSWAYGGFMATALPRWYFEGDGVISETEHTASGRGRLPSFNMEYHALLNEDIRYTYEKAAARSIKDFVPDWYPLGYNILSYGKKHYGDDLWPKVVEDAVRYKGLLFPFNRSLKKRTGMSAKDMYHKSFQVLEEDFKAKRDAKELTNAKYVVAPDSKVVTNYTMPRIYGNDLIMMKSPFDDLNHLVRRTPEGDEEKLCYIGRQLDGDFGTISVGGNLVAWSEMAFDLRWRYRQYSDVYTYNLSTGVKVRVTNQKRYASPALSRLGRKIAAVYTSDDLYQEVHVISSGNGEIIKKLSNHSYGQLSHPTWISDSEIAIAATKDELASIVVVNVLADTWVDYTDGVPAQLSNPHYHDGSIYYSSSESGVNNIYRLHLDSKVVDQVTEVPVGAFQPLITSEEELIYAELESDGIKLKKRDSVKPVNIASKKAEASSAYVHEHESILGDLEPTTNEVKKFNKWSGILKPHSLLPQFAHPLASATLLSDNVFGTMRGSAGATYNYNEDEWSYFVGFTYAELFPEINVSYVHGNRSAQFFNFQSLTDTSTVLTTFSQGWSEDRLTAGLSLPFNLSKGNTNAQIRVGANYQYAKLNVTSNIDSENNFRDTLRSVPAVVRLHEVPINSATISTLDLRFNSSIFLRQARMHLNPRLGAFFNWRLRKQLSQNLNGGDVMNINAGLFLPGVARTHSISVTTAFQKEDGFSNYRYSDLFSYPRGYNASLRRDQFFKIGLNYALPLWYPDIAVGPLAFVKRVKANVFFDIGQVSFDSELVQSTDNINSAGIELGFDLRAVRLVEVDLGVRYSYAFSPGFTTNGRNHQFEFFVVSITQ